jgi:glycosyltransferase involved in cell wall biosynthesis
MSAVPLVSVVIPTFNRGHCVATAVESVLAQSFGDVETIVVDNGSTDNTQEVLARFGSRIRVIRQDNSGVSAARNAGIRAARGQWVGFLDSDDMWRPEKLQAQMQCLQKHQGRVCFTRSQTDTGEMLQDIEDIECTRLEPGVYSIDREAAIDSATVAKCHPLLQSAVIAKELLDRVGAFDASLTAAEDTLLIFNLAFFSTFLYVDQPLTVIHLGSEGSLTYDQTPDAAGRRFASYARAQATMYWRLLETHPEKAPVTRRNLAYFISRRAEIACVTRHSMAARSLAKDCFALAGDWRTRVRGAFIYLLPGLFRSRYGKRWRIPNKPAGA